MMHLVEKLRRIWIVSMAFLFVYICLSCTGTAHAQTPDQPVQPYGHFTLCVFDGDELPVEGAEWSILTEVDGDVLYGTTDQDGCSDGELPAGLAKFDVGGKVEERIVHADEAVYVWFVIDDSLTTLMPWVTQGMIASTSSAEQISPLLGIIKFCVVSKETGNPILYSEWAILAPNGKVYGGITSSGCSELKLPIGTAILAIKGNEGVWLLEIKSGEFLTYTLAATPVGYTNYLASLHR